MIHHAIFGSLSRMIAILLEHHGGADKIFDTASPLTLIEGRGNRTLPVNFHAGARNTSFTRTAVKETG